MIEFALGCTVGFLICAITITNTLRRRKLFDEDGKLIDLNKEEATNDPGSDH